MEALLENYKYLAAENRSPLEFCLRDGLTRSSESDGRSDFTDCSDLQFVLISLIGLFFPDCPDWFRLPRLDKMP